MQRRTRRIIGAVALIGALAAGGVAFTASSNLPTGTNNVAGYDTATVSGATVTSLHYVLSADGTTIDSVVLTMQGDESAHVVKLGFNGGALTTCSQTVAAVYTPGSPGSTVVTCDGYPVQTTKLATDVAVAVTNN